MITVASAGTSATAARTEAARVAPPGTTEMTLPSPSSSASRIGRLLPAGGHGDDDAVDPAGRLEPLEALGEQHAAAERRERLRPVQAEAASLTRGGDDGPDGHA